MGNFSFTNIHAVISSNSMFSSMFFRVIWVVSPYIHLHRFFCIFTPKINVVFHTNFQLLKGFINYFIMVYSKYSYSQISIGLLYLILTYLLKNMIFLTSPFNGLSNPVSRFLLKLMLMQAFQWSILIV